ncbi:sulfurase [Slackia isoflavoniconvertens]|uniref:Sulfurase n=1 Tax=Slackia isoflavoniconvertens TaxID=572010 RepID=A0A369LLY0_9ACTN|nr:sulfurase [Slackia isoflavoniconvertens]
MKTEVGQKGVIRATCISKRKGTRKEPIPEGVEVIAHFGVKNDAHASSDWHRQVSLLAWESIERAQAMGLDVKEGDFAENFCTEGIDVMHMPMGTQVKIGEDVIIEISQIGKVCHTRCAIYYLAGDCIFPREGIFGVVLQGGTVKPSDTLEVLKVGNGTCEYSPADAIAEVEEARRNGTL